MGTPAFIDRIATASDRRIRRENQELQRLCREDSIGREAFRTLMDRLECCLIRLCSYDTAVAEYGTTEMAELSQQISTDMRAEFKALTGFDYVPPICRKAENEGMA